MINNFLNQFRSQKVYNLIYLLLMQKKIGQISEAFQQLHFTEALTIIEQTLKKNSKQDKKQKPLSALELKIIQYFKVGSLVSLGRHHEASIIYQQIISPQGIALMGKENPFVFVSIAELFGQNKERELIQLLQKHFPTFDSSKIHRFYLSVRLFSTLSKLFMKQFTTTKNNMCQLNQAYCEYLNQINKFNMIEYQRDGWYKYNPEIKTSLKLVGMFVERCIKSSEEAKVKLQSDLLKEGMLQKDYLKNELQKNSKIVQRGNELKLKIAINEGRVNDAINLYLSIKDNINIPFTFIRSIVKLSDSFEQKQQIKQFYIREMQGVFRTNLNFATYTPLYDYYQQFFQFLKQNIKAESVNLQQSIRLSESSLHFQQLYYFEKLNTVQILQRYYDSLISEYKSLINKENPHFEENRKSDYYKICIKGLILQIIQVSDYLSYEQEKLRYLRQYTQYFSSTLTYSLQLKKYWNLLIKHEILVNPTQVTNDNHLISEINFNKIWISVNTVKPNREELEKHYGNLMKLYHLRVKEIEKNRKLQKGQRYLSDQFVIILADYVRAFLQHEEDSKLAEELISKIVSNLQVCVQISSFNADLKLRLMYFLSLLNHHERLIQVYITNDIKSVQMETLGYWFLKVAIEFGVESKYDFFFERLIKSYQQNQRQTSEYGLKALKAGELDRVEQYLSYRTNILNSYNSVMILFMLYHRHRFDSNSQYYLIRINERINSFKDKQNPLTFNADFKVMSNILFQDYKFGQIYGLYNSYELLQQQVNVYLHQQYLVNQLLQRNNDIPIDSIEKIDKLEQRINGFESVSLYDFSAYSFQEGKLDYKVQLCRRSLEQAGRLLDVFKQLMTIRLLNIRLSSLLIGSIASQILNQEEAGNLTTAILTSLQKLKKYHQNIDYRTQIRSIVLVRRSFFETYNLLNLIRQTTAKNKKLKGIKVAVENVTSKMVDEYYNAILTFKWSDKRSDPIGIVSKRDQILERELQIDSKEAKRVISRYQSLNKP